MTRELAGRIGSVPPEGSLLRALRQQRWSPLNVPIMWAAAGFFGIDPSGGLVGTDFVRHENNLLASEAVRICLVRDPGCVQELENQRSRRSHIVVAIAWVSSHTAREPHLGESARIFVDGGLQFRRQSGVVRVPLPGFRSHPAQPLSKIHWGQLDDLDMEALFLMRVPLLRKCPRFLRGRLRQSFSFVLRERFRAKLEGDVRVASNDVAPQTSGHRHGRSELTQGFNDFQQWVWVQLIEKACSEIFEGSRRAEKIDEEARRGKSGATGASVQGPTGVDRGISRPQG